MLGLLSADELVREPLVAQVNEDLCISCFACESACPYGAPERVKRKDPRTGVEIEKAYVNPGVCEGCGACLPVCRPKAMDLMGFSDNQIYSEINVLSEAIEVKGEGE